MKKAYLSIGYKSRQQLEPEITEIRKVLSAHHIELFIFVDHYHFAPQEEKQMMQQAFSDIKSSDLLIAEVSEKAIGVGIEIGYAAALQKPLIYLRKSGAEHSTTAAGTATRILIYASPQGLADNLIPVLSDMSFSAKD